MTTTESNGTALANREFSDQQIRGRLETAKNAGFGLDKATQEQLNGIYLLATHYDLDPLTDVTLYQGRPWFTIDGRVRMMRRHPEYAGYRTRPLSADEKRDWGYAREEIVVECTIRTRSWGQITARGKVSPDEFQRQPVAKAHPQEMAEKRAIARASRMAFGQDVPDDLDEVQVIETPPEQRKALAAEYDRIYGDQQDARPASTREQDPDDRRAALWARNRELVEECRKRGLQGMPILNVRSTEDVLAEVNQQLEQRLQNHDQQALKASHQPAF